MTFIDVLILGLVEGLTEFLPVSSTGHLILTAWLLRLQNTDFLKSFEVAIQLGAILAVIFIYFRRLIQGLAIYYRLLAAFVPTAVIGFAMYPFIKQYLFSPVIVSVSLILGGVLLIVADRWVESRPAAFEDLDQMPLKKAAWIGLIQCLAMVPGVSRSGATILGSLLNGCDKKQAMEFSFLLAIPTMLAATGYDLYKTAHGFTAQEFTWLGLGSAVAFVSAWLAVKAFLGFVMRYGFKGFGYYRILAGALFLIAIFVFKAPIHL